MYYEDQTDLETGLCVKIIKLGHHNSRFIREEVEGTLSCEWVALKRVVFIGAVEDMAQSGSVSR
jgi:hypothetical protein